MKTNCLAFNLRFSAITTPPAFPVSGRPRIALSLPSAGWMRWDFAWRTQKSVVNLSYVFALENVWCWSLAIAHRLLPVTLVIDQEGVQAELCADWESIEDDRLRLTLRHSDSDDGEKEFERHVWHDDRSRWLRRLGYTFAHRLDAGFDAQEWLCLSPLWPESACFLPWQWPAAAAPWTQSDWPQTALQAWFFAMLALTLAPFGDRFGYLGEDGERSARLRFRFFNLGMEAVAGFYRVLGCDCPVQTESEASAWATLTELFEETDDPDAPVDWLEFVVNERSNPSNLQRHNRLLLACAHLEDALCRRLRNLNQMVALFPLQPGLWVRDHLMRPGRVLDFREGYWIVDWGHLGFSNEYGLLGAWGRHSWRWPTTDAEGFEAPDGPLFDRWRAFALAGQTWQYYICPCCGYPHLEEEDVEIIDCPICGWPLLLVVHEGRFDPRQPVELGSGAEPDPLPMIADSRRFFDEHGDAFPLDDQRHTAWLRRPDVAELRKKVRAAFDDWLLAAAADMPLPEAIWQELEWMPRNGSEA